MRRLLTPYGRPFPGQRNPTPAPSFELDLVEQSALRTIRGSGRAGVEIGPCLATSTAIRLELLGLVTISQDTPQRVSLNRAYAR